MMKSNNITKDVLKDYKKFPDSFWLDVILVTIKDTISQKIAYSKKSIDNQMTQIMQNSKGQFFYNFNNTNDYISTLLNDELISFKESEKEFTITHKGVNFIKQGGYLKKSRQQKKEQLMFDFEFFKIGYDTIISLLALIISIISLFIVLNESL